MGKMSKNKDLMNEKLCKYLILFNELQLLYISILINALMSDNLHINSHY